MSHVGALLSPVIVARDPHLALAARRVAEVRDGHGQLLLLSGEAGIGKSRLIAEIARLARDAGFRVAKAEVAPQDHDVLAASFLDLGRSMRRDDAFGTVGRDLLEVAAARLDERAPRRRDFVMEVVDLVASPDRPTLLVFEDLQWADDLSLETLTEIARQTRDRPLLIVGAYRTSEAIAGSVLREWRSRLVTQRLAEEVRLDRLTRDETAEVVTAILANGLPAPRDVVDVIHARTDGVPLHIEELCGALGRDRLGDSAAVLEAAVPETLEDAALARIARCTPGAQAVARAGAVIGRSFTPSVLAGVMNVSPETLDDAVQELLDHDVLDARDGGRRLDFRHQLLRDALYRAVPAGDRRRFHARAAEFGGEVDGSSATHASVHFERAGMTEEAFRTALEAGERAMRLASHREAFGLVQRAVDNLPASLPDAERARILLLYSDVHGNIDRNVAASELAERAGALARRAGNVPVALESSFSVLDYARREGVAITVRRDRARAFLNEIEAAPPAPRDAFRFYGLYALAQVETDDGRYGDARELLLEAGDLLAARGERPGWLAREIAKLDVVEGRVPEGLATIRAVATAARAAGEEDSSISGLRDSALFAMRALDYREAHEVIAEGLRHAESVEQTSCGHSLESCEALVSWAEGRWDDAVRQGGHALSDAGAGASRNMAQWALGYVAAGRGQRELAEGHLLPALEYGRRAERLDLVLPALWGLAEASLHAGDPVAAAAWCDEALRAAAERDEAMLLVPFAVTGVRANHLAGMPDGAVRFLDELVRRTERVADVALPAILHATALVRLSEGSTIAARAALEAAIAAWDASGRRWEALWARLDLAAALLRSSRFVDGMTVLAEVRDAAAAIGAEPLLVRAAQLDRAAKGRGAEQEPWHPLTTREFEVARKIAEGLTNAELAGELSISPRTASAHVEHILAKLGVARRSEIAAWATSVGGGAGADRGTTSRRGAS